jgi:surface polysaccharide O-acyltransferase-like enzyme
MIIFIYIGLPFLASFVQKINQKQLLILVIFWWVLTIYGQKLPFNAYIWNGYYESKFTGYFLYSGYLLLGFYLSRIDFQLKKWPLMLVYLATVLFAAIYTYYDSINSHKLNLSIYSYISTNTIVQTIALFMLIKNTTINNKILLKIQNTISNYSYGIYLVHIIFIGVLYKNGIYWSFAHPIISITLLTFAVLICSSATIILIRRIPYGKYISG